MLRLADGDASAVRGPRASAMPPRREIVGRGANEQRAATVVMAAAPVPPRGVLGGGANVFVAPSARFVYVRMVRCIDNTLIQYVSAGPYNTRSGPQELPRPFRRNSAQAMRLFHKVHMEPFPGPGKAVRSRSYWTMPAFTMVQS